MNERSFNVKFTSHYVDPEAKKSARPPRRDLPGEPARQVPRHDTTLAGSVNLEQNPILRHLDREDAYLIGVSGGRDSVALLHWLMEAGWRDLTVCHLDHGLRGAASKADARFVQTLAKNLGLAFASRTIRVKTIARKKRISLEAAGREGRYEFFADVAREKGCPRIFLGHHADDLVETFLINLFRGAGSAGLSAMRAVSTRSINAVDLIVVRPLLSTWRREIDDYVRNQKLKFREDASNRELTPLRNRIRHRVLPYLEKTIDRNIRRSIWRTAAIQMEEESFFETLLPAKLDGLTAIAAEPLRKMNVAVQRRLLQKWLRGASIADVGFDAVERVRGLLDLTSKVAKTNLPGNRHARRRAGKIFLE
jgi:tRNA(Ile)-lysidine synthase